MDCSRTPASATLRHRIGVWISSAKWRSSCGSVRAASRARDSDTSGRRFKCRAPNLAQPIASLLIRLGCDDALAVTLERQVMQHGAVTNVRLLEPLRGCLADNPNGRQALELANIVGVGQE